MVPRRLRRVAMAQRSVVVCKSVQRSCARPTRFAGTTWASCAPSRHRAAPGGSASLRQTPSPRAAWQRQMVTQAPGGAQLQKGWAGMPTTEAVAWRREGWTKGAAALQARSARKEQCCKPETMCCETEATCKDHRCEVDLVHRAGRRARPWPSRAGRRARLGVRSELDSEIEKLTTKIEQNTSQ